MNGVQNADFNIKDFYERLSDLLKKRGISKKNACSGADIGRGAITTWKNGVIPAVDKVLRLANFLDVPIYWLITGKCTTDISSRQRDFLEKYEHLSEMALKIAETTDYLLNEAGKKAVLSYLKIIQQDYPREDSGKSVNKQSQGGKDRPVRGKGA
jgi:transcriptional regulator with XRE-family HTH domain